VVSGLDFWEPLYVGPLILPGVGNLSLTPVNDCTGKGYRLEDLKFGEGLTTHHKGNVNLLYSFG
jgi:hypothetical protein